MAGLGVGREGRPGSGEAGAGMWRGRGRLAVRARWVTGLEADPSWSDNPNNVMHGREENEKSHGKIT